MWIDWCCTSKYRCSGNITTWMFTDAEYCSTFLPLSELDFPRSMMALLVTNLVNQGTTKEWRLLQLLLLCKVAWFLLQSVPWLPIKKCAPFAPVLEASFSWRQSSARQCHVLTFLQIFCQQSDIAAGKFYSANWVPFSGTNLIFNKLITENAINSVSKAIWL